ncbi:GNAT family N-acetyltransferase [Pedobacter sp. PAMC26386]|nr:GNAT family N-acetyltransferase [Pedobacter sp. PAMC26386]
MEILILKPTDDLSKLWNVLSAFRTNLVIDTYQQELSEMIEDGFHLIYISDNKVIAGFAGYRYVHKLFTGKTIYIDDLFTLPQYRGKGYAAALLDYIHKEAEATGMNKVELDSGPTRNDAHRLYLNNRYIISSMHFSRPVSPDK